MTTINKHPLNDDEYTSNDEQIEDLKDLVHELCQALKAAMSAGVIDLQSDHGKLFHAALSRTDLQPEGAFMSYWHERR